MYLKRKSKHKLPQVSTASLPDIVFILLFFFMTVTVMKNTNLVVENTLPKAQEIERLDKKDRVIDIIVGPPIKEYKKVLGSESRIQLNGSFASVNEVGSYVFSELNKMPEQLQKMAIISLKIDKRTQMGIVNDIKEQLKTIGALKINYTTFEGDALSNLK